MSERIVAALLGALVLLVSPPRADASQCGRLCVPVLAQCRASCTTGGKTARRNCLRACRSDTVERCKTQFEPRSACLPPDQWTMLGNNHSSTYRNVAEKKLSVANVGQLKLDWHFTPRSTVNGAPAIVDDVAYVLTGGSLYALDLATRTVRWENTTIAGTASPAYDDGMVFVQTANADLAAVDAATGTLRWRKKVDPLSTGYGSPTVFDRFVVVGSAGIPLPAASNGRQSESEPDVPEDLRRAAMRRADAAGGRVARRRHRAHPPVDRERRPERLTGRRPRTLSTAARR